MNCSLPEAKRVLILSPHPDDESLGCSGTIFLYAKKGVEICVAVISKGEKTELEENDIAEVRKSEAVSVAGILGIKETIFLGFPDKEISKYKEEIKGKISDIARNLQPDIIFAPSPLDPHPDHRATAEAALLLITELPGIKLAFYEIYHPIRFNVLVDITPVIRKKREAILTYRRSFLGLPEVFWHSIKGLNAYRSFFVKQKGFYEAFWLIDAPLTKQEIREWNTFDYEIGSPAEVFLSKLRIADALIAEIERVHASLEKKDAEIGALKAFIDETEKRLRTMEMSEHGFLSDSLSWRFIKKFYTFRDTLLPVDTRRRSIYNKIMENLKR